MSLFYLHLSSFPRTTYGYFLSMAYSCFLWHRLIDHRCTDLFLGSHICFIHLCVFVPLSYSSDYCSFIVQSKIWEGNTSSFLLLSQDCLVSLRSFVVLVKFWYLFQFCETNVMGTLIGTAFNLQIALRSMAILTILSVSIQEH